MTPASEPTPGAEAAEALWALVRARYGSRLTAAQLEEVRQAVEAIVETARAVRAVPLSNADLPVLPLPTGDWP